MSSNTEGLSKTGYVPTLPAVAVWAARALYVGPALGLSPHRTATVTVAVALDRDLAVCPVPDVAPYRRVRSALLPPNRFHHISAGPGRVAFLYLDPLVDDHRAWLMPSSDDGFAYDPPVGQALRDILQGIVAGSMPWPSARALIDAQLPSRMRPVDVRIRAAVAALRAAPADVQLGSLSRGAGLSPSRFLHLFSSETGVPFRRFRYWCRLESAVAIVRRGGSLTDAAIDSGFSSSAHFSSTFRTTFGLSPRLLQGRVHFLAD